MQQDQNPDQKVQNIALDLQKIIDESNKRYRDKLQQITKDSKILIFCGFTHDCVDQFYNHFQNKVVLVDNDEYIKIVRLEKNYKISYLINTPYSLDGIANREQALKHCITKILINNLMPKIKDNQFHLILNWFKLSGQSHQEKLNQITDFGLFKYGQYEIQTSKVSLIIQNQNQVQISYALSKDLKTSVQIFDQVLIEQLLRKIFHSDEFFKINILKAKDYGNLTHFLLKVLEDYLSSINQILENFSYQLLLLQQIPCIEDSPELEISLGNLLNQLNQVFQTNSIEFLKNIPDLFGKINTIIAWQINEINPRFKYLNSVQFERFLLQNGFSLDKIMLPRQWINLNHFKVINDTLRDYLTVEFEAAQINQVKNFQTNIKCWNANYSKRVECIIYKFKQVIENIQEGPQEDIEVGVFVFGKSRVGKSTFLNLLKNPNSLQIEKVISELRYVLKKEYQTQFKIQHGCISETQEISYFKQGNTWYFDCPGFDDNRSEELRLAHRISLYKFLIKAKKVIGIFLVDSSISDVQVIKDTIDPIYLLLKDKNQMKQENNNWASVVLVKTRKNTKQDYIQNWDIAYNGLLEGKYSFYQEMFKNAFEFPKPRKNWKPDFVTQQNIQIRQKILQLISEKQQIQNFKLDFELQMELKLIYLYEIVLSILGIKIQQIIEILSNQINDYIMESYQDLTTKKSLIQNLKYFMVDQINQENVSEILPLILSWIKTNQEFEKTSQYLIRITEDTIYCLQLKEHFSRNISVSPINIDTQFINRNADAILGIITNIQNWETGLKITLATGSVIATVGSVGLALFAEGAVASVVVGTVTRQIAQKVAIGAIATGAGGVGGTGFALVVLHLQKTWLKNSYQAYLEGEKNKRLRQRINQ